MRVWIACAAVLLLVLLGLYPPSALADPSPDAAPNPGIAAYEAGEYERAYRLLKPRAEAGDPQARHLMARLLGGELPERVDYQAALDYLDGRTRCLGPDALAMYAYLYHRVFNSADGKHVAARAYKEAAAAGHLDALVSLGLLLIQDLERPLDGAAYLIEAWRRGDPIAAEFAERTLADAERPLSVPELERLVEERPFASRWPLLGDHPIFCPDLE